jgi:hypothetical protein
MENKELKDFCEHLNTYKGFEEVRFDFMLIDFLDKKCKENCKDLSTCCESCYSKFQEYKKQCDHHYPRGNDGGLRPCEFCNEEKVIQYFNLDGYFNDIVYLQGQSAKEEDLNPFVKNTNSWFNWNKGKNER